MTLIERVFLSLGFIQFIDSGYAATKQFGEKKIPKKKKLPVDACSKLVLFKDASLASGLKLYMTLMCHCLQFSRVTKYVILTSCAIKN